MASACRGELSGRPPPEPAAELLDRQSSLQYGMLILFALYVLVPFMWVVFTALKTNFEIAQDPLGLPPNWRFENIATGLEPGQVRPLFHQQRYHDCSNCHVGGQPVLPGWLRLGAPQNAGKNAHFLFLLGRADGALHGHHDPALLYLARYRRAGHLLGDDPAADCHIPALWHLLHARVFQRAALRFDRRRQD